MTRKEILNQMNAIFNKGLYAGMIVFRSPVTGMLDERHMYADSNGEVILWLDDCSRWYIEHDVEFVAYLNNRIYKDYKLEITEEDCKDE